MMQRQKMVKIIIGNWKMHGDPAASAAWAAGVRERFPVLPAGVKAAVCPPATLIPVLAEMLLGSDFKLGGQDCHPQPHGPHTGDISAGMLKAVGCDYVIVGHSERRTEYKESSALVREKAAAAIRAGLTPIICVGETELEREAGHTAAIISQQIHDSIPPEANGGNFVLAYEPVWAIGSGKLPTNDEISQLHEMIIAETALRTGLATSAVSVLYGGSVKPANAREILAINNVSGVLVGGASVKAEDFCAIIAAASE